VILAGDARVLAAELEPVSVDCMVTSPPFWGAINYGAGEGEVGREQDLAGYLGALGDVFARVKPAMKRTSTIWVELGDRWMRKRLVQVAAAVASGLDGVSYVLRSDIIWLKTNPVPESPRDRPSHSYTHVLLLVVDVDYFFELEPLFEKAEWDFWGAQNPGRHAQAGTGGGWQSAKPNRRRELALTGKRRGRDVWIGPTANTKVDHVAVMPEWIVERCLRAGCPAGGLVLDPFAGAGTTGLVAHRLGRRFVGFELHPGLATAAGARLA
jgi:DNA modification methylase